MKENPITEVGRVGVHAMLRFANLIKGQNNKVNTPRKFQKMTGENMDDDAGITLMKQIMCERAGIDYQKLDYTLFSCPNGSEPHIDDLDAKVYGEDTWVVPVLMESEATLYTKTDSNKLIRGGIYKFNHTRLHWLNLEKPAPTVLIMFSELQK